VLIPVLLVLAALQVARGRVSLARVAAGAAAVVLLTVAVIWAAYGFQARFSPDPAANASFDWNHLQPPQAIVRASVSGAHALRLLPDPYLYGFLRFFRHSEARPAFL